MSQMSVVPQPRPNVTLRPATAKDRPYLRRLFAESRTGLAILPADVQDVLIDMQYRAKRAEFATRYPDAEYHVVVADDADAGLLILDRGDGVVRVIGLTVDPVHRHHGVAAAGVRQAIDAAGPVPVRLDVGADNAAGRALYERLGFQPTDAPVPTGYLAMERRAS